MINTRLLFLMYSLLVLVLAYTGASRLLNYTAFLYELRNQPYPLWLANILVWFLPIYSLLTALLLIFSTTQLKGLFMAFGLFTFYTGYTILVLTNAFGRTPCNCAGMIGGLSWWQQLAVNLVLVFITLILIYSNTILHASNRGKPKT